MKNYIEPMIKISLFSEGNIATTASSEMATQEPMGADLVNDIKVKVQSAEYKNVFNFNN